MSSRFDYERPFNESDLEVVSYEVYRDLFIQISKAGLHPLRIWNSVSNINKNADENGSGENERYKLFNRGRRKAWLEYDETLKTVCSATCVGSFGPDLVKVSALATSHQVIHIENPDQISFLDYSTKYGTPPSSRRGTLHLKPGGVELLIAGTASITGEDNRFAGDNDSKDFEKQTEQTLKNIQTLISDENIRKYYPNWKSQNLLLTELREIKVYLRNMSDQEAANEIILSNGMQLESVEFIHADICRRPLNIEIEGMVPAIQVLTSLTT